MASISSRPGEESVLALDDLVPAELELITALLCNVKLGRGWPYRDAALSILTKIEKYSADPNFLTNASDAVDVSVNVLDGAGQPLFTFDNAHFEIIV